MKNESRCAQRRTPRPRSRLTTQQDTRPGTAEGERPFTNRERAVETIHKKEPQMGGWSATMAYFVA
jgi:hypothetical protein